MRADGALAAPVQTEAYRGAWRWVRLWHLLSLDAPTVAVLWAWFLARSMRLRLVDGWTLPLLALATWLMYVTDRILDGLADDGAAGRRLRERHHFYQRHRRLVVPVAAASAVILLWASLRLLPAADIRDYCSLGALALVYLALVHAPWLRVGRWLPKELAVAVIFASATAVPAWSLAGSATLAPLASAVALFAGACWLNCVAIEAWETPRGAVHATTRWAGEHLGLMLALLALASLALLPLRAAAAVLTVAAVLAALQAGRARLSPMQLRIAADLALLTPLLWLRW